MTLPVLFETLHTQHGAAIGIATLNAPQVLNGLSLTMVDLLSEQLAAWATDPTIAVIVLGGAGDKAFCAGGDLHGLYASMQASPRGEPWANVHARTFFEHEYRLDYQIHHYPKPILCWGHGFVMGGGVGLLMGASHRVLTERSRVAMPEISIGLFPDVGGSWLLSRMPGQTGRFLALTGAQLNAADSMYVGLADHVIAEDQAQAVIEDMLEAQWEIASSDQVDHPPRGLNDATLTRILKAHAAGLQEPGPLARHAFAVNNACSGNDLAEIAESVRAFADHVDPWLARAAQTFMQGSPGSARLSLMLQQRAKLMSLADVFRMEYVVALSAAAFGDLQEGIRALIIDKDKTPRWQSGDLAEADEVWAARFLTPPWPDGQLHPLADLE